MSLLIKNGRVIDPANNLDDNQDILIENSKISKVAKDIKAEANEVIDAFGKIVMPGIIDMHVHLREPGREDKETIETGTKAGLKGGVTSVLAMPNTQPAIDCIENLRLLKGIIKKTSQANVLICATITKGRLGKELIDVAGLKKEGVIAISDDGTSVDSEEILLEALKQARQQKLLVICHCEDKSLSRDGLVNLGIVSTRLGLRGVPKEAEYKRVARDIQLAEKIGAPIHIAHLSCKESVELIAEAKKNGLRVTAETAPHYFSFTEESLLGYDTNFKVNPPLRTAQDLDAIKQGLKNGIIDCIASDHAPHTINEKDIEFERAEFGTIGLETELAACITELVEPGLLAWPDLVRKLTTNPARILGIERGALTKAKTADIIIVAPGVEWQVKEEGFVSKSRNSAFIGKKLKGQVEYTIIGGEIAYINANRR